MSEKEGEWIRVRQKGENEKKNGRRSSRKNSSFCDQTGKRPHLKNSFNWKKTKSTAETRRDK